MSVIDGLDAGALQCLQRMDFSLRRNTGLASGCLKLCDHVRKSLSLLLLAWSPHPHTSLGVPKPRASLAHLLRASLLFSEEAKGASWLQQTGLAASMPSSHRAGTIHAFGSRFVPPGAWFLQSSPLVFLEF